MFHIDYVSKKDKRYIPKSPKKGEKLKLVDNLKPIESFKTMSSVKLGGKVLGNLVPPK